MTTPQHARQAAALLREGSPTSPAASSEDRAFLIAHLEVALARKARRRAVVHGLLALGGLSALAASIVLYKPVHERHASAGQSSAAGVAVGRPVGDGAELVGANGSVRLLDGQALPAGSRLLTFDNGGASLALASGTSLNLEHDASLEVVSTGAEQRFTLRSGAVSAKVAKLGAKERFLLSTPDSEVEVHGTAFRVSVAELDAHCEVATRTRVAVSEGVVEVRSAGRSWYVKPGESWPSHCEDPAASAPPKPPASARAPEAARPKPSSLSEQNDLFARGVAAMHAQDAAGALAAFDTLMQKFPTSGLVENASVKRMEVLRSQSPAAARSAAREYLQRYPNGYAREQAEKLLAP